MSCHCLSTALVASAVHCRRLFSFCICGWMQVDSGFKELHILPLAERNGSREMGAKSYSLQENQTLQQKHRERHPVAEIVCPHITIQ